MARLGAPRGEEEDGGLGDEHAQALGGGGGGKNGARPMEGVVVGTGEVHRGPAWGEGKKWHMGRALVDG
jgi:hypothetical protein